MPKERRLQLLIEENQWKNSIVMQLLPGALGTNLPHFLQSWLRSALLCAVVYFSMSGLWVYYTYYCFGDKLFQPGAIPESKAVWEQVKVSSQPPTWPVGMQGHGH